MFQSKPWNFLRFSEISESCFECSHNVVIYEKYGFVPNTKNRTQTAGE